MMPVNTRYAAWPFNYPYHSSEAGSLNQTLAHDAIMIASGPDIPRVGAGFAHSDLLVWERTGRGCCLRAARAMLRGALLLTFMAGLAAVSSAQGLQRLVARDALIDSLYKLERYAEVMREVELQAREAEGTAWSDSLHRYTYKLGRAAWKTHGVDAGAAAAERINALVEHRRGKAEHLMQSMASLGQLYYHMGRIKDCLRVDSLAVQVATRQRDLPPHVRGKAFYLLGTDHGEMGRHEDAIAQYRQARQIYGTAGTTPGMQLAELFNAMGVSLWHLGRVREADRQYKMALEHLSSDSSLAVRRQIANIYGNLGILWQDLGDFARSKAYYQESLLACEQVIAGSSDPAQRDGAILSRAKNFLNLATGYYALGDNGRAAALLEMSMRDRRSILEPDDPVLILVQERMASVELDFGEYEQAEKHVQAYVDACAEHYGRKSEYYISGLSKLAYAAYQQGHTARADSLFGATIALATTLTDGTTDQGLALTYMRRALMYQTIGRYNEALDDLKAARAIVERVFGPGNYFLAKCDAMLAEAAVRAGHAKQAQQYGQAALGLIKDRVEALAKSNLPQTFPEPGLLPDVLYWKIRAERDEKGKTANLKKWTTELDLAIRALDRNKLALNDRASQLQLIASQKRLFNLALDVAFEAWAASRTGADIDRFLAVSEANRSILLKNRLNQFAGMGFAGVPDSILDKEQQLLSGLDMDTEDRGSLLDLDKKETEYAALLQRLERNYPEYYDLRYGETRVTLKELRKDLLTPQIDLLIYAMSDAHLYMMVVRQDTVVLQRVDNAGVEKTITAMAKAISERQDEAYFQAAHALYQQIFAPVAPFLKNTELLILPDGPLHKVNFEVLLDNPSGRHDFRKHLLVQRHAVGYLLSATTAVQFARLQRSGPAKMIAMAPGFSDDTKRQYLAGVKDSTMIDQDYLRLVRQPFAVRSAVELGSLLSARVMLGNDANEAAFREQAKRYNILHLGTHAEMNPASPLYSKLVLAKPGEGIKADEDGYLHAYEIYELELNAQLAVLTACETGAGTDDEGEGVRSLGYSFAYAGCPSLVISLWGIDEKTSSDIIARFYRHLAAGMPKHLALRQAKLDHLAHAPDELAAPYYWAGLVLVGDVAPLEISVWKRRAPWVMGAALVLAALAWVAWRRRKPRAD